ncbi:MFS transporter [Consotaella aegiceratis]|uniref:MFS transporter n=1 Tax=Consotaella aegiceratis TaxID=3097961 RepID=UPI002F3FDED1
MSDDAKPISKTSPNRGAVAVLALAMLLASLGVSIATVALPALARDFHAPVSHVQWVMLAYLLSVTVVIVSAGRLGDMLGQRPVFLGGLAIFAGASALCATAPSLALLIVARALQGIGGAVLMAQSISLVRDTVAKERTGTAMGLLGTMSAIGTALGPSAGGLVIASSGWRTTFVVLALLGSAGLFHAACVLPRARKAGRADGTGFDWPGMLVLTGALTAFCVAVTAGRSDLPAKASLLLLCASAFGAVLFIVVERRAAAPLVQPAALRSRAISSSLLMNLIVATVMMSTLVVGPFYLTIALGLNEALVGSVMAVGPATAAVSGVIAGRITDAFVAPRVLLIGLAQTMVGLVCLAVLPMRIGVAGYVLSLMVLTPGFQLFLAANTTAVMSAAPEDQRGSLSGLLGLSRNLGFMSGGSIMGTVFAIAAGTPDIAQASPEAVSAAFTATFLTACGLTVGAFAAALVSRPAVERRDA